MSPCHFHRLFKSVTGMTPKAWQQAAREQRLRAALAQGVDVVGYYHSHPDHPAIPSEFDREHALPFYAYIIVAVAQRQAGALTSWRLTQDRLRFLQEEVHIVS